MASRCRRTAAGVSPSRSLSDAAVEGPSSSSRPATRWRVRRSASVGAAMFFTTTLSRNCPTGSNPGSGSTTSDPRTTSTPQRAVIMVGKLLEVTALRLGGCRASLSRCATSTRRTATPSRSPASPGRPRRGDNRRTRAKRRRQDDVDRHLRRSDPPGRRKRLGPRHRPLPRGCRLAGACRRHASDGRIGRRRHLSLRSGA